MPPSKALISRRKNISKAKEHKEFAIHKQEKLFVLSVLVAGLTYTSIHRFFSILKNNISIPSESKFHIVQNIIGPLIEMAAHSNTEKYLRNIQPGTVISLDGSNKPFKNIYCVLKNG